MCGGGGGGDKKREKSEKWAGVCVCVCWGGGGGRKREKSEKWAGMGQAKKREREVGEMAMGWGWKGGINTQSSTTVIVMREREGGRYTGGERIKWRRQGQTG